MDTLLLTDNEVKELLKMSDVINAVEIAFKEKGLNKVQMPAKIYLHYNRYNGDLRSMPAFLDRLEISAAKIVNVHPENPLLNRMPTVMATIVLIDPKTGFPLCIMGGTTITNMRTGAAGAVAAKYLAKKDCKSIGFIGAGAQARTQLSAILTISNQIQEIRVWSRTKKTRSKFLNEAKKTYGDLYTLVPAHSIRTATKGIDIIVTTTPSREPIVKCDMISPGVHINCIGADAVGKQELDSKILTKAKITVDDWKQAAHSGEINVPLHLGLIDRSYISGEIGEIVAGLKPGRENNNEITIFVSTGLAIQDAITAKLAFDKAKKKDIGQFINIVK
ncbi:MAG: alanine dehydrogenase [Candidatus Bathyarchaeota archaeon]|nr:alanine dehydrogenase [Candidatus Bathyarchaeota archaeon]